MIAPAQHYPDEQLLELPADHPHLASCDACREALQSIQELAATLHEEIVWNEEPLPDTPRPATVTTLRSIATQMDAEDADASRYLAELLAVPREQWLAALAGHPHYRTPGFVRRLIVETDRLIDSRPADVVELTAVAVDVADGLDAAAWYGDTVPRLRGAAWRERAYALYYVGKHVEALAAADRAAGHLEKVAIAEFDSARLMLVRALVLRALERYDEALATASATVRVFAASNDERRWHYVRLVEAMVAYAARNYRYASTLFEELANEPNFGGELPSKAIMLQNLASCHRELGEYEKALSRFGEAVRLFEQLGMDAELTRARWHIGRVLLQEAKFNDAANVLRAVKDTYERLQIHDKAAIAAVDLAEASLMMGRPADVLQLCQTAIQFYRKSGLAYTENALTALSLVQEAARSGVLRPGTVGRVRSYLERLPTQPNLLFAHAPE